MLYAPFVKAQDKVAKKDAADLSLADFQPKRFALNYEPPMISKYEIRLTSTVLEYLVPTTGKLYHHKMKLRRLTGKSTVSEALKYLQKRHPLYFLHGKVRSDQITDLLKRLIYRLKQKEEMEEIKTIENSEKVVAAKENTFKQGNARPSVEDTQPSTVLADKAKKMFDDLDGSGEDEFDANELMNLGDYKGKRSQKLAPPKALNINDVFDDKKKAAVNS